MKNLVIILIVGLALSLDIIFGGWPHNKSAWDSIYGFIFLFGLWTGFLIMDMWNKGKLR